MRRLTKFFEGARFEFSGRAKAVPRGYFLSGMQVRKVGYEYHYVYALLDEDNKYIYIGETSDLDERVLQHRRTKQWWHEVCKVKYEATPKDQAKNKEKLLIEMFSPKHNKLYKQKRDSPILQLPPFEETNWAI